VKLKLKGNIMSVASQFSFGNAAVLTTGTLSGNRGVTAGTTSTSFIEFNGNVSTAGQFDSSNTAPTSNTRLNYNGDLYATSFIGGNKPRVVTITDATSVTMNADTTDIASQTNTQSAGTLTINAVTGTLYDGQKIIFRLQSANTQTFSWNAVFVGSSDISLPSTSTGSNKYDYMGFIYNSTATKWQLLAKNFGF
jgi:hypothetical protein